MTEKQLKNAQDYTNDVVATNEVIFAIIKSVWEKALRVFTGKSSPKIEAQKEDLKGWVPKKDILR